MKNGLSSDSPEVEMFCINPDNLFEYGRVAEIES
jgi:hypothetical protein